MRKIMYGIACMLLGSSLLTTTPMAAEAELVEESVTAESKTATTVKVAVKEGADIARAVNDAIAEASLNATAENPYKIVIPAGKYKLSTVIRMYSNITLDATGATIQYDAPGESHNMIMSGTIDYNNSKECSGYNGYENMSIIGGHWISTDYNNSSLVKIVHAKNVTIKKATFEGGGGIHMVEVCAIDTFNVTGCTFKNFKWNGSDESKQEALQFDIPCAESVYKDTYQDGTMMKNVTVSGCTFKNVPRGMGTHTELLGAYHENITIKNNKFQNIKEEAIVTVNYYNCEITGNTIKNCGAGILMQTFKQKLSSVYSSVEDGSYEKKNYTDLKVTIKDNTFDITYNKQCDEVQAIKTYGYEVEKAGKGADGKKIPAGDYRVMGVTVQNNTITTEGHGIVLSGSVNCLVTDNQVTGGTYSDKDPNKTGYDGVFVAENCDGISVTKNTVTNVIRNGIFVKTNSKINDISDNKIVTPKYNGISIADKSQVTGSIAGNTIKKPKETGISITTGSSVSVVTLNTIENAQGQGINIFDNSKVTKEISSNTISSPKDNGIIINDKSRVKNIIKNVITTPKGNGMNIYSSSKVTGSIKSNTIEKPKSNGIIVNKKSSVASIVSNKILSPGGQGMNIYDNSKVTKEISKNKISKAKGNGIIINKKSSVASIKKNTITSPGGQGMNICESSKVTKVISGNTISNAKTNGIIVNSKSTVAAIKSNTITAPGGHGMNIYAGSKVTKDISDNTITDPKGNGIIVNDKCTVNAITGNTISKTKENGINIFKSSVVKKAISGNTIKNAKKNAIMINQKSTVGSVEANTLNKPSGAGVLICNKAVVKGDVIKNKITKPGNGGVKVTSGAKIKGKNKSNKVVK